MNKNQEYLSKVKIATPCKADWDKMTGDERMRHCQDCNLNVYNIAEMTEAEATELIQNRTGRLCIQLFRRPDGTVITKDCPKGLERVKRAYRRYAVAAASLFAWLGFASPGYTQLTGGLPGLDSGKNVKKENSTDVTRGRVRPIRGKVAPIKNNPQNNGNYLPPIKGEAVGPSEMGDICVPVKPVKKAVKKSKTTKPKSKNQKPKPKKQKSKVSAPGKKKTYQVVNKVNLKSSHPIDVKIVDAPVKARPNPNSNKLLASGLAIMLLAAVSKFVFGNIKRRSSIWIVGSSFAGAFIAIGLLWQLCW